MKLSIFSLMMSALSGSCLVLLAHLLRRRQPVIKLMGVRTLLLLEGLSALRLAFVFELPFIAPLRSRGAYLAYREMRTVRLPVSSYPFASSITLADILMLVWLAVAAVLVGNFLFKHIRALMRLGHFAGNSSPEAEAVLRRISENSRRRINVGLCVCPGLDIPIGAGIIRKRIYLPDRDYSEQELYYILLHEYRHFCGRDLHIKLLVCLLCRILWWNPLTLLLRRDIEQLLEIRCDLSATQDMDNAEKARYLSVLLALLKISSPRNSRRSRLRTATPLFSSSSSARPNTLERFELIANPGKLASAFKQWLLVGGFGVVMALSLIFVVHPAYYNMDMVNMHMPGYRRYFIHSNRFAVIKRMDGSYIIWDGEHEMEIPSKLGETYKGSAYDYYEESPDYERRSAFDMFR